SFQLPVEDAHRCLGSFLETPGQLLSEHDGSVVAACAAERDDQARLALRAVCRQGQLQELHDELEESSCAGLPEHVVPNGRFQAGQALEVGYPVRIGQESDVEDEVRLEWDAELEAKGDHLDGHDLRGRLAWNEAPDALLQLPDRKAAGVDDVVRKRARPGEAETLLGDRGLDAGPRTERVA